MLAQNASAIALLKRLGEAETTHMGREVELAIDLMPSEAPDRDLLDVLREVAAGALAPGRTLLSALRPQRAGPPDRARLRDTIVVGTDGSEEAAQAVRCAAELAPALGVSVELVAVHWPLLGDRDAMEDVLAEGAARLRELGHRGDDPRAPGRSGGLADGCRRRGARAHDRAGTARRRRPPRRCCSGAWGRRSPPTPPATC